MTDFSSRLALYWPALLDGALTTLWLCAASMVLGFLIGVAIHLLCNGRSHLGRAFARVYVSFFRGTPVLAQLMLLFYLPSALNIDVSPLVAAGAALALMLAGPVTSIPALIALWGLFKRRVMLLYLVLTLGCSLLLGWGWQLVG